MSKKEALLILTISSNSIHTYKIVIFMYMYWLHLLLADVKQIVYNPECMTMSTSCYVEG